MPKKRAICKVCKKEFEFYSCPKHKGSGRGSYCSNDCRSIGISKKEDISCAECGIEFQVCLFRKDYGRKYCSITCRNKAFTGEKSTHWKGGISKTSNGYKSYSSGKDKGRLLHRVLWESKVGTIPDTMEIHHINGDKTDNRIGNLRLMEISEHRSYHAKKTGLGKKDKV